MPVASSSSGTFQGSEEEGSGTGRRIWTEVAEECAAEGFAISAEDSFTGSGRFLRVLSWTWAAGTVAYACAAADIEPVPVHIGTT